MQEQIFRKKSLDNLSAPEDLNDYLHVTRPAVWVALIAVIVTIVGLLIWSSFVSIESKVKGTAVVHDGVITVSLADERYARNVNTGMTLRIGKVETEITSVGKDEEGNVVAGASADLPDGRYECGVSYKSTKLIKLLFN